MNGERTDRREAFAIERLSGVRAFRGLNAATLSALALMLREMRVAAGDTVMIEKTMPHSIGFLVEGACNQLASSPRGGVVTMSRLAPGSAFGFTTAIFGHSWGQLLSLVAHADCTFAIAPGGEFRSLIFDTPELCANLLLEVAALSANLASRVYELALLDVRARLQAELLRMAERGVVRDTGILIEPAPTHSALAQQLGTTREAVSRQLLELQREGIITAGRRSIEINNLTRLKGLDEAAAGRRFFPFS